MHEVSTSIHISADCDAVWRALCQTQRLPIVASAALHQRIQPICCPRLSHYATETPDRLLVCHFDSGSVEETVECDPTKQLAFTIVGGSLNRERLLSRIRDRFILQRHCHETILTRITEFDPGPDLSRVAPVPKVKRTIRKLQLAVLSDVKLSAERNSRART